MQAVSTLRGEGLEVAGIVCHVGSADDRQKLVDFVCATFFSFLVFHYLQTLQKYGRIDILVNNAAQNPHFGDILEVNQC